VVAVSAGRASAGYLRGTKSGGAAQRTAEMT
jgi:hypothetical protein